MAFAVMIVGAPTSSLAEARVFIAAKNGALYLHTNYTESMDVHPAKLASDDRVMTLDESVARVIYLEQADVNMPLIKQNVTLYVDRESCKANNYALDCGGYAHVKEISLQHASQLFNGSPPSSLPSGKPIPLKVPQPAKSSELSLFLAKKSTRDAHLFALEAASGTSATLAFPTGTVTITADELKALGAGRAMPRTHPLSEKLNSDTAGALIMYTPEKILTNEHMKSVAGEVCYGIQNSYPRCRVVRAPMSESTFKSLASLKSMTISGPDDIVTVIDNGSFGAADQTDINGIEQELGDRGFSNVVALNRGPKARFNYGTDRVIIVITGRTGADMTALLSTLYEAGAFNGNYVILNSCSEPLLDKTVERVMSGKNGAKAIFSPEGAVKASALRDSLVALAKKLSDGQPHSLFDVVVRAFQLHNLNGVWSLC